MYPLVFIFIIKGAKKRTKKGVKTRISSRMNFISQQSAYIQLFLNLEMQHLSGTFES